MTSPIQVGDCVTYYGHSGHVCEGIVAERAISPLTGNVRCRIVDLASEMPDLDAGIWRGIEGDIISVDRPIPNVPVFPPEGAPIK